MAIACEVSELANGLRVVTTCLPTAQSVSVNLFAGVGSRCEERRVSGLAHFLEHMLFKGSRKRPSAMAIAEAIEGAGGTLNAYTSKEVTCYWNHVPDDRLALALDVVADMIQAPLLEREEIERERSVVCQEIRRNRDQPAAWVGELLQRACYGDHPLGWSTTGSEETVAAVQREDFLRYMETWYVPANLVLSVAGNARHQEVVALAQTALGGLGGRSLDGASAFPPLGGGPPVRRVAVEERPIAQCNLALALPGLDRRDPDRYILMVLNNLLGRGMSSRLFREVRERRGLAYSISSSVVRHSDTGLLVISAGVGRERLEEALRVILAEVGKLAEEGVTEEELARARDYSIGSFRLGLETAMALGQRAGELLLTMGEVEPVEAVVEKLRAVTAEDVQRVAGRVWQRPRAVLAAVGPDLHEEALLAALSG